MEVLPSPKLQLQEVPPVELLVNAVAFPKQTVVTLKFAVGCGFTVTTFVTVEVHPAFEVTVSVTE